MGCNEVLFLRSASSLLPPLSPHLHLLACPVWFGRPISLFSECFIYKSLLSFLFLFLRLSFSSNYSSFSHPFLIQRPLVLRPSSSGSQHLVPPAWITAAGLKVAHMHREPSGWFFPLRPRRVAMTFGERCCPFICYFLLARSSVRCPGHPPAPAPPSGPGRRGSATDNLLRPHSEQLQYISG